MTVKDFDEQRAMNVIFGKGMVKRKLADALKNNGAERVLLTYGKSSIKKLGIYEEVVKILKDGNIPFWELSGIRANPEISDARKGIEMVREHNINFILSVGGGSVLDLSKAISVGYKYEDDVWDIFENFGKMIPEKFIILEHFLPIGCILTLAATGSEVGGGMVVSNDEKNQKLFCIYQQTVPKFSILDPSYTCSVSERQTKAGSCDILSHCLEQYFSKDDVFMVDRFLESVMITILHYTPIAINEPDNYEARSNIMLAASLALVGIGEAGKGGTTDWATHWIQHELAAINEQLPHGIGLAIVGLGWMDFVARKRPEKFLTLGRNLFRMEFGSDAGVEEALSVISKFEEFYKKCGIPTKFSEEETLKEFGEKEIEKATETLIGHYGEPFGAYVELKKDDCLSILKYCMK